MTYLRVLPRDLFNESKLLKCLGAFHLICDGSFREYNVEIVLNDEDAECEGFRICQDMYNDGALYCENYEVLVNGHQIRLYTHYNSKAAYPLYVMEAFIECPVLDEKGALTGEFERFLASKNK